MFHNFNFGLANMALVTDETDKVILEKVQAERV